MPQADKIEQAPTSVGGGSTCNNCHGGGGFSTSISVEVRDASNNLITVYAPGAQYKVKYTVTNGSGNPAGYSFQSVALKSANAQAGSFTGTTSPNGQISTLSGRQYPEHQGISSSGVWEFDWTAPVSGTGNVTLYSVGMSVNGASGSGGDDGVRRTKRY